MNKKQTIILGIYGSSNSGKTGILVKLVSWLTKKGFHVASIKKTDKPIIFDQKGKDTKLHEKAGASPVVFSTIKETTFIYQRQLTEIEIIKKIQSSNDVDVILIEGCKDDNIPKLQMDTKRSKRKNTIFTYQDNIETIKTYLINELQKRDEI
jgi:molybdopterin-guanine dinucleotide biosynthesis protein B